MVFMITPIAKMMKVPIIPFRNQPLAFLASVSEPAMKYMMPETTKVITAKVIPAV